MTAFEAAARHGSFTDAAAELSLTQSAISKQIRALETTLSIVLFARTRGRVSLTSLGERYLISVRRILRAYEAETHSIIASGGSILPLRIAVLPTFATRWLIPRLPEFLTANPSVNVHLITELNPFDFKEKPVDLVIHHGSPDWPMSDLTYLCREQIIAVARPGFADKTNGDPIAALLKMPLLQQSTRPMLWQQWFDHAGIEHPHAYRGPVFDQFAMTIEAAIAGVGAALVPKCFVEKELHERRLHKILDVSFLGPGAYYAVTPQTTPRTGAAARFIEWLLEATHPARLRCMGMGGPSERLALHDTA
ncbi:MAG: LysR family transcriptional regulator [Phyllobacterium sp.]